MTVGIAAVCNRNGNGSEPAAVLAADRLVTAGVGTRIEYEHTSSKMVEIIDNQQTVAMGVAAGSVSYADELFYKLDHKIHHQGASSVRDIASYAIEAFQEIVRESMERQVLRQNGYTLHEFKQNQKALHPDILASIYQDMMSVRDQVVNGLNILIAGTDADGAHIYSVRNGDMARLDSIGYHAVGSGSEPANSTFIRNRYDDSCSIDDALYSVVEAKMQAERAQGVGERMDLSVIKQDLADHVDEDEVSQLRNTQKEISSEQQSVRERVIGEKDYSYT